MNANQQPRALSRADPQSPAEANRNPTAKNLATPAPSKSYRGYYRQQFEQAWRSYRPADGTPAQASVIKQLRSVS
jgi:hypothetical protein